MASAMADRAGSVAPPDSGRRQGEGISGPPPPHPQPKMSPKTPDRASPYQKVGVCFACQQEGHWSRDCPSKKSAGRAHLGEEGGAVEVPECKCGAGPCLVQTSRTEWNPGRKFFTCPVMPHNEKCRFFQWCDSPNPRQPRVASSVQQHLNSGSPIQQQAGNTMQQGDFHPTCQCGAGWCILLTMKEGENAGRKYFSCPRKKSNERCNFRRWYDEFNLTGECMERPIMSHPRGSTNTRYPDCTCGAGRCRLLTMELGEYAGRKYFGCPVKKGQGACNFFQWQTAVEGDHENGRDYLVGDRNQHPDLVMEEPRDAQRFNIKPTSLNFDDIEVGESNAGSDKARPPSPLERRQGDANTPSIQNCHPGLDNSIPNVALKPGKCYGCGKEGHWRADCVESLPFSPNIRQGSSSRKSSV